MIFQMKLRPGKDKSFYPGSQKNWRHGRNSWLCGSKHQFVLAHLSCCHVCKSTAPRQVGSYDIAIPGNIRK